jgi:hypothetical protein
MPYPITASFEAWAESEPWAGPECHELYKAMRDILVEYEHGTADIEDVFEGIEGLPGVPRHDPEDMEYDDRPDTERLLKVFREVCKEVLMYMIMQQRDKKKEAT